MPPKIVVVGSLNMDLIVSAPRIPEPGETIIGHGFHTAAGGKGANQAVAAARLGAQVIMVGCVGGDAYGETLRRNLAADGVDTSFVGVDTETHTGIALITVDDAGQNSIVVSSGANWRLSAADVDAAEGAFIGADMLVLQLETRPEVVERAAALAVRHGVPVALNPAPARPLSPALLAQVDYLIPNESETALLSGRPVTGVDSARAAARTLRGMGIGTVVLTLGGQGAFLITEGREAHVPAFSVEVVDTTAAGDAFVGGFAVAVASGWPLPQAARFAAASGALATTRLGAQPSLPTLSDVERLLRD
ncbi:MAG: ribokinase [Chloroflexota bacterium]